MSALCSCCHKHNGCNKCLKQAIKELCHGCYEYRNADGSYNNEDNPEWGKSNTVFGRALGKPFYKDGISEPVENTNAREISNLIFGQDELIKEKGISAFFWLWGQFVDHSVTLTEEGTEKFDIKVPKGDIYFDPKYTGTKVIPMTRSQPAHGTGDSIENPRQQINTMSSYLDAANVYGNSEERLKYIRTHRHGKMKNSGDLLPPMNNGQQKNAGGVNGFFVCGDLRANENLGLTSIHSVFVREHNHWAEIIYNERPSLSDEEIFQRAKILVEAEIQAITYNEWLPILIGKLAVNNLPKEYDNLVNSQINDIFSTAAFRFGHTMVSPEVLRLNECGCPIYEGNLDLRSSFFAPYLICNEGGIDPILRGFGKSESEKFDSKVINDLRNFLFGKPGDGGLDLAAINIQRGRDNGLPSFNQTRQKFGLKPISDFNDISDDAEVVKGLEDAYKLNREKCDLWVCCLAEKRYKGLVGETIFKILEDQFKRMKAGDRFFYEWRLPKILVNVVNETKLSDIIRRNTKIKNIQDNVFEFEH